MKILKIGDKITYNKEINFGTEIIKVSAKVMMILNGIALLDNGDEVFAIQK